MSIPGFGDAVTIWDTAVRVITFINDLRHAQDDFLGLRSEAECLRVCINALNSDECEETLFYISVEQGQDLKSIITTCEYNMKDLNGFIAKCATLAAGPAARSTPWWKLPKGIIAKGFAKWKFTMTDKQAFRDKLALPTASINIFLTSLTHVSLSRLMRLPGIPAASATKAGVSVDNWDTVGYRVAFRDTTVRQKDLTTDLEDDIVAYVIYRLKGGSSFRNKQSTKPKDGGAVSKSKSKRKSSGYQLKDDQMYLVRPLQHARSRSRIRTGSVEIVDETIDHEYESGSETSVLLIEPPTELQPSRQLEEQEPSASAGAARQRQYENFHEGFDRQQRSSGRPPTRNARRYRKDLVQQQIRREQLRAVHDMDQTEAMERRKRPQRQSHAAEPDDQEETIEYLAREYGVIVQDVDGTRPPIDSGVVRAPEDNHSPPDSDSDPEIVRKSDKLRAETACPTSFRTYKRRRSSPPLNGYFGDETYRPTHFDEDDHRRYRRGSHESEEDNIRRYKSAEADARPHVVKVDNLRGPGPPKQHSQGYMYDGGLYEQATNDLRGSSYAGSEGGSYPHRYTSQEETLPPNVDRRRRRRGSDDSDGSPPMLMLPRPR